MTKKMLNTSKNNLNFVDLIINSHLNLKEKKNEYYLGKEFSIYPHVFDPFLAPSGNLSLLFASLPNLFKNKRVLEVGSGTGIISSLIALNGANYVLGIDRSEIAIQNALDNKKRLNISNLDFLKKDIRVDCHEIKLESFDIYFADLPLMEYNTNLSNLNNSPLQYAFFDKNLLATKKYIQKTIQVKKNYPHKRIFLCISSLDELFQKNLINNKYKIKEFINIKLEWVDLRIVEII